MVENGADKSRADQLTRLTTTLRELEGGYCKLLGMLRIRREQVRRGNIKMLHAGLEEERDCLKRIAALDDVRSRLVGDLAGGQNPGATGISIETVLPLAKGELASDLLGARSALRKTLEAVQSEYAVLQQVGESMFGHVSSLIQRIRTIGASTGGGSAVYGRDGRFDGGRPIVSGVDIRT